LRLFSFAYEEITVLQRYVLMCGRSVTAFLAPPRSQRPGQGPPSPHPKAGPEHYTEAQTVCVLLTTVSTGETYEIVNNKGRDLSQEKSSNTSALRDERTLGVGL
jgi:hypothetical protein